jgi:hypothetical protein
MKKNKFCDSKTAGVVIIAALLGLLFGVLVWGAGECGDAASDEISFSLLVYSNHNAIMAVKRCKACLENNIREMNDMKKTLPCKDICISAESNITLYNKLLADRTCQL